MTNPSAPREPILDIRNLRVHFPIHRGFLRREVGQVKAVDGLDFTIEEGETLGLVGESGSGKTTAGRALLRIYEPTAGTITFKRRDGRRVDIATVSKPELKSIRREMRMIFQDPYSSLNPRLPVIDIIGQPLKINGIARGSELQDRVALLMRRVGLRPEYMRRYPHAFSGGERQRIGIARAIALDPRFIVSDEAVSALDVSVQAQIIRLLRDLQQELGLTYLFVGHDLAVVQHISARVAVLYAGRIVELGPTAALYAAPRHPYTEALLSASPRPDPRLRGKTERIRLPGEVADLSNLPPGCSFHPRCRYANERCRIEMPELRDVGDQHKSACHYSDQLALKGVKAF